MIVTSEKFPNAFFGSLRNDGEDSLGPGTLNTCVFVAVKMMGMNFTVVSSTRTYEMFGKCSRFWRVPYIRFQCTYHDFMIMLYIKIHIYIYTYLCTVCILYNYIRVIICISTLLEAN